MSDSDRISAFIADWAVTGGSELANTQSFVNGLCALIGVDPPRGSQTDDANNDYVFERRVFQDNGDGTISFGRLDAYKRGCFVLEAKQGSDADREAASRGERDFFGKPAAERVKQGTAKRGTPGWASAMFKAKGQAERYAKALPVDHGWPPFLIVTDVGHCIDVYADFSGTGKQYTQFPDAARFRIMLDDLRDDKVRDRLATIWTDPLSLDPSKEAARVTRLIAGNLADLSKRLEKREQNATRVADFLMRCLFTMFAEDVRLIPEGSFTALLKRMKDMPKNFPAAVAHLWKTMDGGGWSGELNSHVLKFNGYLFKDQTVIALDAEEIGLLIEAAEHKWNHVEPAIFGTLLERALDGKERAKLGAHYTPRAYVERLVMPTVIDPLRTDWAGVQAAAASLIDAGKADEARGLVELFHGRLAQTRVLDPACGTGNFLYVAMARMKELEGEVVGLLTEFGDDQYVAELSGHTITPENFLGIEINPRAAAIAQLVLWIGYLQWHFRVSGEGRMPPEPVLRDVKTIENRDALIDWDKRVLEKDKSGKPLTRWDGETTKLHPVTGKKVPDDDAQVEVWRYVNPKAAKWPKADFIVGNPPYIGVRKINQRLGERYVDAVRAVFSDLPGTVDFVMYWWDAAARLVRKKSVRRFGFITTNSIVQDYSRPVVERHIDAKTNPLSLVYAVTNHPWVENKDGAAVDVAMTVGAAAGDNAEVRIAQVKRTGKTFELHVSHVSRINAALRNIPNVFAAKGLKSNKSMCFQGVVPAGEGFKISAKSDFATDSDVVKPYMIGDDLTERFGHTHIIDFFGLEEAEASESHPAEFSKVFNEVKPERDQNPRKSYRDKWWLFAEPRPNLRKAVAQLKRYIGTPYTAVHRPFVFLDSAIVPDAMIYAVASSDPFVLGVLSSGIHKTWCKYAGGTLQDRPRYNSDRTFLPFPFPAMDDEALVSKIQKVAEKLDLLRKRVLAEHDDLTLTGLYNVLEKLRAGTPLSDKDRDLHDRGLVTILRQHHDEIDRLVAEAYGWPSDLGDEAILTNLIALNRERAAGEAKGLVQWLRPEFQAPGEARVATNRDLDLGDTGPAPATATIIPWPKTLPEQVSAVAALLSAATTPQHPRDIARAFDGKRAASVTPLLDALTAIGQARRLDDGRYAA